jgi:BASS family bile acid:Na+ symporter
LLGVVVAPLLILLLVRLFGVEAHMVPAPIAGAVLVTVVAPLAAGMAVRQRAPDRAERIARSVSAIGAVFLLVGIIPVLAAAARGMISLVGNGRLLALAVFVAVGLATGHLLGGPDPDDRGALALATALRHPGIALAIARANFPDEPRAPAAILLYLIVSLIVTRPYLSWSKRRRARRTVPPPLVSPYS